MDYATLERPEDTLDRADMSALGANFGKNVIIHTSGEEFNGRLNQGAADSLVVTGIRHFPFHPAWVLDTWYDEHHTLHIKVDTGDPAALYAQIYDHYPKASVLVHKPGGYLGSLCVLLSGFYDEFDGRYVHILISPDRGLHIPVEWVAKLSLATPDAIQDLDPDSYHNEVLYLELVD